VLAAAAICACSGGPRRRIFPAASAFRASEGRLRGAPGLKDLESSNRPRSSESAKFVKVAGVAPRPTRNQFHRTERRRAADLPYCPALLTCCSASRRRARSGAIHNLPRARNRRPFDAAGQLPWVRIPPRGFRPATTDGGASVRPSDQPTRRPRLSQRAVRRSLAPRNRRCGFAKLDRPCHRVWTRLAPALFHKAPAVRRARERSSISPNTPLFSRCSLTPSGPRARAAQGGSAAPEPDQVGRTEPVGPETSPSRRMHPPLVGRPNARFTLSGRRIRARISRARWGPLARVSAGRAPVST